MADEVQIPSNAVSPGTDVRKPVRAILEDLYLLGTPTDMEKAHGGGAVFAGPPQSVALIEAGATAATKWWATGLGASVVATWGALLTWWDQQEVSIKVVALGGTAFVTAAVVLAIGYLIASDVRGRAAAAVSQIQARARLAEVMIRAAQASYDPKGSAGEVSVVSLSSAVYARNLGRPSADEDGWLVVAMERHPDGEYKYLVAKGSAQEMVPASGLEFN